MLYQGLLPIVIEVENGDEREHEVQITLARGSGGERCDVLDTLSVAPHASEQRLLFGTLGRSYMNSFHGWVSVGGHREPIASLGPKQPCDYAKWPVLYAHAPGRPPDTGSEQVWGEAFSHRQPAHVPVFDVAQQQLAQRLGSLGYVTMPPGGAPGGYGLVGRVHPDLDR
jgi:hypothetical protein